MFSNMQIKEVYAILTHISDTPVRGGPPYGISQKSKKLRFFFCCDTLMTIQPREKTQLTKVVSPLKRFGRHLSGRGDNRIFGAKISVIRSTFSCIFGGGVYYTKVRDFLL